MQKWIELFEGTDARVLAVALDRVTRDAERMPTPGMLTKAIRAAWDTPPPGVERPLRYSYDPNCPNCLGTGYHLKPVPYVEGGYKQAELCACRTEEKEHIGPLTKPAVGMDPETGEPVNILVDQLTGQHLYKAQDCPEGRAFLASLQAPNLITKEGR